MLKDCRCIVLYLLFFSFSRHLKWMFLPEQNLRVNVRVNVGYSFACDPDEVDAVTLVSCAERRHAPHLRMRLFLPHGLQQINTVSLYEHCKWSKSLKKKSTDTEAEAKLSAASLRCILHLFTLLN